MRMHLMKAAIGGAVCVMGMASIAAATNVDVGVGISTPNMRLQVGTQAPPPRVTVVERERVIVKEVVEERHDNGKHKGHKKHKKHKKHDD